MFSNQQREVLAQVKAWVDNPTQPVFRLFGYAGTGKTTLALELSKQCQGRVAFAAFTGKAASVMAQRGCVGATTIHRLIYTPTPPDRTRLTALMAAQAQTADPSEVERLARLIQEEEALLKQPRFVLSNNPPLNECSLAIIDECSMVGERMGRDLLSHKVPLLVLGDPAQLPPIGSGGFFTEGIPDALLTEVHRQARDSGVLALATRIREGGQLTTGIPYVLRRSEFTRSLATWADQVIVGRNKTRRWFNLNYRAQVLGHSSPNPQPGEKLVCLRNNHDLGILNGEQWVVMESSCTEHEALLTLASDTGEVRLSAHRCIFLGQEVPHESRYDLQEFDFGYALTCHKAQGSQWGKVLVFDESAPFGADANRWLYTAVTRAQHEVRILI